MTSQPPRKTPGNPRTTISDPSVSTFKKPSMPERAAYLEKVKAGMNSKKVTRAPKPATAPSTMPVGARPSPRRPPTPSPEALAARAASRAELGARLAERAKAVDAARVPSAPRDKTSTVGRSKIMYADRPQNTGPTNMGSATGMKKPGYKKGGSVGCKTY